MSMFVVMLFVFVFLNKIFFVVLLVKGGRKFYLVNMFGDTKVF